MRFHHGLATSSCRQAEGSNAIALEGTHDTEAPPLGLLGLEATA
jgi:hypothetical protein